MGKTNTLNGVQSFFMTHEKMLKIAAATYVVMLILSHWQLPSMHVWVIAAVFSLLMNFTYIVEALSLKSYVRTETLVAALLIVMSFLGLFTSPLILIFAIFGHGVWDLQKHFGRGVPFFSWYTCSCFIVDTVYGSTLLFYFLFRT